MELLKDTVLDTTANKKLETTASIPYSDPQLKELTASGKVKTPEK